MSPQLKKLKATGSTSTRIQHSALLPMGKLQAAVIPKFASLPVVVSHALLNEHHIGNIFMK